MTKQEAEVLMHLVDGGDVFDEFAADIIRKIEKDSDGDFVTITRPLFSTPAKTERHPYFGAIATKRGIYELKKVLGIPLKYKIKRCHECTQIEPCIGYVCDECAKMLAEVS